MTRFRSLVRALSGILAAVLYGGILPDAIVAQEPSRFNLLFIVTDDQAPWAVGASGHPDARTPHLDALFKSGAYLRNCFTPTPVCSPARTSILTSRYGSELGITDWINPRVEPALGLAPGTPAWPALLRDAGYHTALIGKWHLGSEDRSHPSVFGYQDFMGFREGGAKVRNPRLEVNGDVQTVRGFTTDILTDEAIRWIRLHDPARPFALSLHYRAPHAPWLPLMEVDWSPFRERDVTIPNPDYPDLDIERVRKVTREYLGSVANVDRNVGRLLGELLQLGLAENTVVIFTSDHGYNMGHNGIWHKGNGHWIVTSPPPATPNIPLGQRPNMYDLSLRTPTAVRWPGVTQPGQVIERSVSHLDWFPTVLDIAGVDLPEGTTLRGRSMAPLLKGATDDRSDEFYAEYSTHHQSQTHMRMYRTLGWKLVRDFLNEGRDELYDLKHDPAETKNLIDSTDPAAQQAVAELHARILERMESLGDPVLKTIEK